MTTVYKIMILELSLKICLKESTLRPLISVEVLSKFASTKSRYKPSWRLQIKRQNRNFYCRLKGQQSDCLLTRWQLSVYTKRIQFKSLNQRKETTISSKKLGKWLSNIKTSNPSRKSSIRIFKPQLEVRQQLKRSSMIPLLAWLKRQQNNYRLEWVKSKLWIKSWPESQNKN